jgi:hypothetical protein
MRPRSANDFNELVEVMPAGAIGRAPAGAP